MSNTEDSDTSPTLDGSHPSSPTEKPKKCSNIIGGVVSKTMAVTSILKTTTRSNDQPTVEIDDVESGLHSSIVETTETQCTTIVQTTSVYTTAIDTTAVDASIIYTTSVSNGCNTTTPRTVDTISCTCCTLIGSSEDCSKNEKLQSDRLEFLLQFLNVTVMHSSQAILQFYLHVMPMKIILVIFPKNQ